MIVPQQGQTHIKTTPPAALFVHQDAACSQSPAGQLQSMAHATPSNKDRGGRLAGRLASKPALLFKFKSGMLYSAKLWLKGLVLCTSG
jgi:hypothetical protein